jgi:sugar phosphate isomerase/epimerase
VKDRRISRKIEYAVAISEEELGEAAPVPFQGGIADCIARASAMGFECVELHVRDPVTLDAEKIAKTASAQEVRIAAVGTGLEYSLNGLSLTSDERSIRRKAVEKMKQHIDFAARFAAVVFLGLLRGKCGIYSRRALILDRLAGELVPIVAYASERKVILGLEPVAYYFSDILNTTDEALDFIERPGLAAIQLLLDTHHMFIEDQDTPQSFRKSAGRIAHVHISDSNRRHPGAGNVDFTSVADVLDEIGYAGAISLEILPLPDGAEAARRGLAWMQRTWGS